MTFDSTLYAWRIREYRKRLGLTQDQLAGEVEADSAASLAGAEDDDDVRRRRFLELAGTLVVGQHMDAFRCSLDAALDRDLDGMDIEEYEQAVHAYATRSPCWRRRRSCPSCCSTSMKCAA